MLDVDNVTVTLGGTEVLSGVSLHAPTGQTTAVLGPSGCGKTTLLRVITGLVAPDSGTVVCNGTDVTGVAAHRRGIGLVFQDHALFPHRNVADNVAFGLKMAGSVPPGRVDEVLALVGLDGFANRAVGSLSGGEAQRVALARALAPAPTVLCLDEPLAALDRNLHDRLVGDLRALFADLATTVVHVTHDQREALALADHLVILGDGVVAQAGPPRLVWQQPASVQVARFLGQDMLVPVDTDLGVALSSAQHPPEWHAAAAGARAVVIRPDAVTMADPADVAGDFQAGPGVLVRGVVADVAFEGDRTVITVEVRVGPRHPINLSVVGSDAVDVGQSVVVAIDPTGTWPVGD